MVETFYHLNTPVNLALLTDSHNIACDEILQSLENHRPQIILIAGDFIYGAVPIERNQLKMKQSQAAMFLLQECANIAPTFVSLGNHEWMLHPLDMEMILKTGAVVLDNDFVRITISSNHNNHNLYLSSVEKNDISDSNDSNQSETDQETDLCIGGLSSARVITYQRWRSALGISELYPDPSLAPADCNWTYSTKTSEPDLKWLQEYQQQTAYKILLCHHPEYYQKYLKGFDINLICSGHAHGGQWRVFNHGIWAPGQGFWPKYTSGVHDGKLVISQGLSNPSVIPRLWNPPEIVYMY